MSVNRDVLYILNQPQSSSGPIPDVILTTQGSYDTTNGLTLDPPVFGTSITASAALTYDTVFIENGVLGATDPGTGVPNGIASLPGGFQQLVSLGGIAIATGGYDTSGDTALLRTDGTFDGTAFIVPAAAGPGFAPTALGRLGGVVLFAATDLKGTVGLWRTDGSDAGTVEVAPSIFAAGGSTRFLGVANGRAIFATNGSIVSTDGTAGGTRTLGGPSLSTNAQGIELPNGSLVVIDGGSVLATDGNNPFVTVGSYGAPPLADLVAFGSGAAFVASTTNSQGTPNQSIVVTDGTAAGTHAIVSGSDISALSTAGSTLLFAALDPNDGATGLWASDGTAAGTSDIDPGIDPLGITNVGLTAFVVGADTANQTEELYSTDGTAGGTGPFLHTNAAQSTLTSGLLDTTHLFVSGTHDQYEIAVGSGVVFDIVDTVQNRDGAASDLAHVVSFADGTGVLDTTGNAEALARVYQSAFDRGADLGGLIAYTEQLDAGATTLLQVADIGAASPEFIGDNGMLSDSDFVTKLYENTVGRAPDAGGLASYVADLNAGDTRGAVLLDISQSFEARHDDLGVAGQANDATIYRLYQTVVDRAPDLPGQQFYSAELSAGVSVQAIASGMLASGEYASRFGNPSDQQFVTDLYQNLLQRAPDAGGLATYTADLANGTSRAGLVAAFVGTDEGRLATALATHDGWVYIG